MSRQAKVLATAFPPVNGGTSKAKRTVVTGMPVRPELEAEAGISKEEAVAGLNRAFDAGLKPDLPTVLIFGGSQGASVFNRIAPEALRSLDAGRFQVLHLAGPDKLEETREAYRDAKFPLLLLPASEKMGLFLGAADLVLSRSGGSTVAELALFGKAAVLIPYPYAAEGHQADNARYLADADAAVLVDNTDFTARRATELFRDFLDAPEGWRHRAERARALAKPHAAETMLAAISDYFDSTR
ncbi:UDP-N-acetylglucosamine--N-acetylmuramyl-(pentapeptide) pyrophosphoryl-undecaprenol N-acetylglucosamine transferase [Victivallis vadensis]|uniref:UDP-N-acetylglucosamine--N-acetylmuramyl- (pentapeptide) pyrophosphoryl-undecaprenol N-acetylglucosamine transferase n=1 Tax=Victivallis vadensis TaxID=172901 RepID=UPI0002F9186E|nr:glycosyltransferase [Victivallis vadensis]